MKLKKKKNKNQNRETEHQVRKNKSFIISIITVILVSILLYPIVMKNPHIRNLERLIKDEVEDNEFTLKCNSKRGQVIERITVYGDKETFSEKDVCEKIDKIQKIIYQYISENPSAFNLSYRESGDEFRIDFNDSEKAYFQGILCTFVSEREWDNCDNNGFDCLFISSQFGEIYQHKFSELSNFADVRGLYGESVEIDKPELLNNMEGLREIYLAECTGDIEGLIEKAKEMNIEYEIGKKEE